MVTGVSVAYRYADLYESGNGMIRFDFRDLYLLYGFPIYALLYGIISFINTRRIWIPQLILFAITFAYWFRFDIVRLARADTYIWSVYPVAFSLIGASVTAFICFVIKSIKEDLK